MAVSFRLLAIGYRQGRKRYGYRMTPTPPCVFHLPTAYYPLTSIKNGREEPTLGYGSPRPKVVFVL